MLSSTLSANDRSEDPLLHRKRDTNVAISVENLAKSYTIVHEERQTTLIHTAMARAKNPLKRPEKEIFWALNGVTFDVQRGEVVGIIGRNGAGKSTLLKVLSRITEPTRGRAVMHGRVGSLLEVGTGFHPELTGRENVYLNGAVLGMSRQEVTRQFDAIVDFSGTEKFLDTPVKRYSSGMYVRLAFAVAAHLNPEILIVDEVLAVGDGEFQKKCLGKMQDVAGQGRTVLFVSHNATAVRTLCNKVLWLDKGKTVSYGDTGPILNSYLHAGNSGDTKRVWDDPATAPSGEGVVLTEASVYSETGESNLTVAMPITLSFSYTNSLPSHLLNASVVLYNEEGVCIFNSVSAPEHMSVGKIQSHIRIPADLLNDGVYFVRFLIVQDASRALFDIEDALKFEVHDVERKFAWHGKWIGAVRPDLSWDTTINESIDGD